MVHLRPSFSRSISGISIAGAASGVSTGTSSVASGATVSSKEVLKLAVAVANQYVNDKVVLNGGAA